MSIDGEELAVGTTLEGPLRRHNVRVALPPDGSAEVTFVLSGSVAPGDEYRLFLVGQPLVNPSEVTVDVHAASGDIRPGAGMAVEGSSSMLSLDGSTDTTASGSRSIDDHSTGCPVVRDNVDGGRQRQAGR